MATPPGRPRSLPASWVFLLAVVTTLALEAWTRATYHPRDGLLEKAARFAATARPGDENLVILGTCLPEQHLRADVLDAGLGGGWVAHNLGNQATNPLDWQLTFANALPHDRVQGLVLAYGARDLVAEILPWESRVMDLAGWRDLPDLARTACGGFECAADLALRLGSRTWRYRARLANRVWGALDALPEDATGVATVPDTRAPGDAPLTYLGKLLADAHAAGIPVWTLALPTRPSDGSGGVEEARYHARVDPVLRAGGARALEVRPLDARFFADDTHLTGDGAERLSEEVAEALRAELGLPAPAAPTSAYLPPRGPATPPPPNGSFPPPPLQMLRPGATVATPVEAPK